MTEVSSRVLISKLMALSVVVMWNDCDGEVPVAAFSWERDAEDWIVKQKHPWEYYTFTEVR